MENTRRKTRIAVYIVLLVVLVILAISHSNMLHQAYSDLKEYAVLNLYGEYWLLDWMSTNILTLNPSSLLLLSGLLVITTFGAPTGAILWVVSFASLTSDLHEAVNLIFLAWISLAIGDGIVYTLANKIEAIVRRKVNRFRWFVKNEYKARSALERYGAGIVFFSRLIPYSGPATNYVCGFEKISFRKFLLFAAAGDLAYSAAYVLIGYHFKNTWLHIITMINSGLVLVLLIIAIVYIAFKIEQHRKYKNIGTGNT